MMRNSCLICNSKDIEEIIDLGSHPFADTFIPKSRYGEADKIYPLICDLCSDCGNIQLRCITDPEDRYSSHDYSYTSSNSKFARDHWENYAEEVAKKVNLKEGGFIVDIGSNDGYLGEQFLKKGYCVVGVDPSEYMANLAKERKIETFTGIFDEKIKDEIIEKCGNADLVVANNVFNHSNDPLNFAKSVSQLLSKDGKFVFELPYWYIGLENKKFDQIYHEHVTYFTVKSSKSLLENAGMKIISSEIVDYHGGSLRIIAQNKNEVVEDCLEEKVMIEKEELNKTFEPETYHKFMKEILEKRNIFLEEIYKTKNKGFPIIGVGAAAKGNTFLNFYSLDNKVIDYVTDASEHKKGKYTPATRIPIVGDDIFSRYNDVYALILSWNISHILKEKLHEINPNIKFISLPS